MNFSAIPARTAFPAPRRDKADPHRIGIVLHDFALGGTERIAARLASAWANEGQSVTIFCGSRQGPMLEFVSSSVRVEASPSVIERSAGSVRKVGDAAARFFSANPVQTIFVPGNYHWPVIAPLARMEPSLRPRIVAQVSSALHKLQRSGLRQTHFEFRSRRRLAGADAIIALSHQNAFEARKMLRREIATIPLPVLADDTPPPQPVPARSKMVLAAGRLVAQKDFSTLIRAFAELGDPAAKLVILGEGPQRSMLENLIRKLDMTGRIEMPGYVSDIRPWLDRSRLFVLSSAHEGYGAVIVEALAAGRPVITTDCTPAAGELVGSALAGTVVPVCDVSALADAMHRSLADSPPDPGELSAMVDGWKIGPIAQRYLRLFNQYE